MVILDFLNLDVSQTKRLNEIASEHRKQYTKYIDQLSADKENDFTWWITGLATRNSDYFPEQVYKFLLIKETVTNNQGCCRIFVNEIGLYRSARKFLKSGEKYKNVEIYLKHKSIKYSLWFRLASFIYQWFKRVLNYFAIQKRRSLILEESSTIDLLIDTYVLASCFDADEKYNDRYFNGILEYLNGKTMFSAILVANTKDSLKKFLSRLEGEKRYNFLIREKYLTLSDYFVILNYPIYCMNMLTKKYNYVGNDISSIIRRGIIHDIANDNTFDGYITYLFLKRLKKRKIHIRNTLLWYEGQPSSMGFIMGMREFYPEVPSKGYLGVTPMENMLSLFPSEEQIRQNKFPSKMGVMGEAIKEDFKVFCKKMEMQVYPAFRYYSGNFALVKIEHKDTNVLVVLPYSKVAAKALLEDISKAMSMLKDRTRYNIYIKNHPVNSQLTFQDYHCNYDIDAEWVDGQVIDLLTSMDIAVNAFSSSSMEIIAKGVFLINYIPCGALSNVGIPDSVPKSLYQIAYNASDIYDGFNKLKEISDFKTRIKVEDYYEPVTRESVERMLL